MGERVGKGPVVAQGKCSRGTRLAEWLGAYGGPHEDRGRQDCNARECPGVANCREGRVAERLGDGKCG